MARYSAGRLFSWFKERPGLALLLVAAVGLIFFNITHVDLLGDDVVRVFRALAPNEPTIFHRGETAEAEPAVPGWKFAVDELFQ